MRKAAAICLLLTRAACAQVPADAAAHAGQATQLMEQRRYVEAAIEFEAALRANPIDDPTRVAYAVCLFEQERNDDARTQFEFLRTRLGSWPGLNYYLGRLDLRANNARSAIERLQPLENEPAFPQASLYLGLSYLAAGQAQQAREAFERAVRKDPRDPEAHYRLARAYTAAGREADAAREYEAYRGAHELERVVEEYGHQCMDALRTQPIAQARSVCGKIADHGDPRRMELLGEMYAEADAFPDALGALQEAVKLDATSFEAWHYLGLSLYGLGRYREAVEPLKNAAALNPQYFDTLNLLAKTYHVLGNDAAAIPVAERAHNLNPRDTALAAALEQMKAAAKSKL